MNIYFDCIGHLDCVCVTVWDHLTLFIAVVLTAPLLGVLVFFRVAIVSVLLDIF